MGLKATLDTIDDLDDGIKGLYTKTEDGKFRLDVEGFDDGSKLKSALDKERTAAREAQRQLREMQERYGDIDPDAVKAILSKFASDEEAALIAKGDIDTVLTKRTDRMKADYDKKLQAEAEAKAKAEAKAAKLADRTLAGALRDAAIKAGALPEALEDIVLRARGVWRLGDDGEPVAMADDEVVLGKDGKTPLSPAEWAESLRETAPHLWPRAQGTNAPGSNGRHSTQSKRAADMTPQEKAAFIAANGFDAWTQKIGADYAPQRT